MTSLREDAFKCIVPILYIAHYVKAIKVNAMSSQYQHFTIVYELIIQPQPKERSENKC